MKCRFGVIPLGPIHLSFRLWALPVDKMNSWWGRAGRKSKQTSSDSYTDRLPKRKRDNGRSSCVSIFRIMDTMVWTAVYERNFWLLPAAKPVSDRLDCIEQHLISEDSSALKFVTMKSLPQQIVSKPEMIYYWNYLTSYNTVFLEFSYPFQNGGKKKNFQPRLQFLPHGFTRF